jgi:hypothetical protein
MEDHSGELLLDDAPNGGARITLVLPAETRQTEDPAAELLTKALETHGT